MSQEPQNKLPEDAEELQPPKPPSTEERPRSLRTRILAGLGAVLMVILVLLYTYSLATGGIFAW